jgi:membrane associated rhomboid family serine protease
VDAALDHKRQDDPRRQGLILVGAMAAVMWAAEIVDSAADANLDRFGIEPRELEGLDGVVLSPFLHAGFNHLAANTLPFVVMGAMIALSGVARVAAVTAIVALVGGIGTWLIAPADTIHIGASGIVFGYGAYLISRGIYSRRLLHFAAGALIVGIWGTTLLAGLAPEEGISWQGHLFGAVGGVVAASLLDRQRALHAPGLVARD